MYKHPAHKEDILCRVDRAKLTITAVSRGRMWMQTMGWIVSVAGFVCNFHTFERDLAYYYKIYKTSVCVRHDIELLL